MRRSTLFVVVLAMLSCVRGSYGMATEQFGPDSLQGHPTTAHPSWPIGIVQLLRHESRVYSIWVNGNENFYFKANPHEINELISLFSETRMRDHELWIKPGKRHIKSFNGDRFNYNVNFHVLGGIAVFMSRRDESPSTYEPTVTVYVDPSADQAWLNQITLPPNIILSSEVANCPLKGKATRPKRKVWHAQVLFDDSTPAADFEHGLLTKITLWEKDIKEGIKLGKVSHEGYFRAAFSDKEIADMKTGNPWLTMTVGNWRAEASRDHPKLSLEKLALDKQTVQPVMITKPKLEFYYGRILFEDGSPPILNPAPWPGAEIRVRFPFAGSAPIDPEGYFKVHFTRGQYDKVKADRVRKNIYIPSYEKKGRSTARFAFPISKLFQEKQDAGVVRIPKPSPKSDGSQ